MSNRNWNKPRKDGNNKTMAKIELCDEILVVSN